MVVSLFAEESLARCSMPDPQVIERHALVYTTLPCVDESSKYKFTRPWSGFVKIHQDLEGCILIILYIWMNNESLTPSDLKLLKQVDNTYYPVLPGTR